MYTPNLSLADPPADSPIGDSLSWVQGVALGSIATTIAVMAVAAIGLLMLSGRLELRRGVTAVIGCFILFGSGGIAAALTGFRSLNENNLPTIVADAGPLHGSLQNPPMPVSAYDPYAGASVPTSQ